MLGTYENGKYNLTQNGKTELVNQIRCIRENKKEAKEIDDDVFNLLLAQVVTNLNKTYEELIQETNKTGKMVIISTFDAYSNELNYDSGWPLFINFLNYLENIEQSKDVKSNLTLNDVIDMLEEHLKKQSNISEQNIDAMNENMGQSKK